MSEKKTVVANPLMDSLAEMTKNAIKQAANRQPEVQSTGCDWDTFRKILDEKAEQNRGKGKLVWIDEDLKREIDRLKVEGLDIPTKYVINAIIRAFLQTYRDRMNTL